MAEGEEFESQQSDELALVSVRCKVLTANGVRRRLAEAVAKAPSVSEYSRVHGLSEDFVRQVISGRKPPGGKILVTLGLERRVIYCEVAPDGHVGIDDLLLTQSDRG